MINAHVSPSYQRKQASRFRRDGGTVGAPAALEHDPQKWKPLLRKDHAQAIDLARVLFDQVIPPGRNAR
jgi:hypothetical protein